METILENSLTLQGTTIKYSEPVGARRKGGGIRGKITHISDASRRNLMNKFAVIDWDAVAASGHKVNFITLTTPPEYWSKGPLVYEAHRKFEDYLDKCLDIKGHYSRKEIGEKSGMLHYHFITLGRDLRKIEDLLRRKWTEYLAYEGENDVIVDVDKRDSDNPGVIGKYICKYMGKAAYEGREQTAEPDAGGDTSPEGASATSGEAETGAPTLSKAHNVENDGDGTISKYYNGNRWWYERGAKNIPKHSKITIKVESYKDLQRLAKRIRRIFRKWRKVKQLAKYQRENPLFIRHGIPERLLSRWVKTPAYRFMNKPGGFSLIANEQEMIQILKAAVHMENCVYTFELDGETLECFSN